MEREHARDGAVHHCGIGSVKRLIGGNGCRGTILVAIVAEGFGAARRIKPLPEMTPRDI